MRTARLARLERVCLAACWLLALPAGVTGTPITFATPDGARIDNQPVSARAKFTTGHGFLVLTLANLATDIHSIAQNVSGVEFELSTGEDRGVVVWSNATRRSVGHNGAFSDAGFGPTGWLISNLVCDGLLLTVIGTPAGPEHTLIGEPGYSNANGSIRTGAHNPFLAGSATFVIWVPDVTEDSVVTAARFYFGTSRALEDYVDGQHSPEPGTLLLLASALATLGAARRLTHPHA